MCHQERKADDFSRSLAKHIAHGDEIALGFRHLDAADGQHAVVQPVAGEGPPVMGGHTLRDLVLVVWKHQIKSAAMDVEGLAQRDLAHRRAFDVPAPSASAPWASP